MRRRVSAIHLYVGALSIALCGLVAVCVTGFEPDQPARWLMFATLFGLAEYVDIFFHHARGRQSLNPSETMLLPMLAVLPFSQATLAVVSAMLVLRAIHWREGLLRFVFNVAQYGLAAAAAAGVWAAFGTRAEPFSPGDAAAAIVGVVVFAAISHVLTAAAIAISESISMLVVLRDVTATAAIFLLSNVLLGLLLTAAYLSAPWTLALFPLILVLLALASRAVLTQTRDRERAEHLHTAARALAVGLDVETAVGGFLGAVLDVVSAMEVIAVTRLRAGPVKFRARRGERPEPAEALRDPALLAVLDAIPPESFLLIDPEAKPRSDSMAKLFAASNLIAVPLTEGNEVVGALIALDRVGPEDFGPADARLLKALAQELVLSLASFRLFDQVLTQRERFRTIFDGSKEGICLLDDDGRVQAWNPALNRMTGFEESEMLGIRWSDRITLLGTDGRQLEGVELGTVSPDANLELVTHHGASLWVSVTPGAVTERAGSGWVVLVRDVTAERNLEQAKMDFLTTVSHELRTPMTGLKGTLDVLGASAGTLPPEKLERVIGVMSWGAERLERLIMNLLIVSEISAGDVPLNWGQVDVGALVKNRADEVLRSHRRVDVAVPPEEILTRVDPERLSQAIDHVLENARRFGGPDGRITVAVSASEGTADIRITDEGPGIPTVDRAHIFERFVRLGDVMTRRTQGAGVGLFIAKRSLELLGGGVTVEDSEKGACFRISLPLVDPPTQAPAKSRKDTVDLAE